MHKLILIFVFFNTCSGMGRADAHQFVKREIYLAKNRLFCLYLSNRLTKSVFENFGSEIYARVCKPVSELVRLQAWHEIADLILDEDISGNFITDQNNKGLLHHAVEQQQSDAVAFLLEHEASPNEVDEFGFLPEEYNIQWNNPIITGAFTCYCLRHPGLYTTPLLLSYILTKKQHVKSNKTICSN